ncbi:MAG TPA: glycoside hydrolase family 2 TIM barrel-domain containing protein [Oscillatoriaceae cyanobacterium]
METLALSGMWQLLPVNEFLDDYTSVTDWHEQELPAHWQEHPALETHVGKVVYRKRFSWKRGQSAHSVWLRLRGVFYRYRLRLNGKALGTGEGYFFPQEHEVTSLLTDENELIVEVDSPVERSCLEKEMITGVFAHWDALSSYKYNPGGIWLPVELQVRPEVHVRGAMVHLERFDDQAAHVALRLDLSVKQAGTARWHVRFTPHNFDGEAAAFDGTVEMVAGDYGWSQQLSIAPYKLWWSHDLGFPHLYKVEVTIEGAGDAPVRWEGVTGLRTWEMRDYVAYLNGQKLYIKGSNYPPGDARLGSMTRDRALTDVRLAKDAHMNMLRVHAHVDHPELYRAADEEGLLLWQDFPLQWLYAKRILPEALRQSREMVRLLHNHPSIVIWCLHNEPLHVDDTSVEPLLRQLKTQWSLIFSWNRDVMDTQLMASTQHLDPSRTVIRSSGEMWLPLRMDGTDGHYYFGWYMSYGPKRWFEIWRRVLTRNLRFVTEFGAQSFPNLENARKFLPENLEGADFKFLNRHYLLQWDIMKLWVDTSSTALPDLVEKSQDYHSEINRYYVDRLRYYKYKPNGGFLNFMFMDSQPCVSWSLIDYWREPKSTYHAYKRALAPQYAFCLTPKDSYKRGKAVSLPTYVVNDAHAPKPVRLHVLIFDPEGRTLYEKNHVLTLAPDCEAQPVEFPTFKPTSGGTHMLVLTLEQEGAEPLENGYKLEVK